MGTITGTVQQRRSAGLTLVLASVEEAEPLEADVDVVLVDLGRVDLLHRLGGQLADAPPSLSSTLGSNLSSATPAAAASVAGVTAAVTVSLRLAGSRRGEVRAGGAKCCRDVEDAIHY
ncbi:hypothetical protein C4D60_Mb09t13970 [Musa balbisiana]|uniref:Uncharacterized protein n=1 Tax=Musa balbisiana TaxID=52838 RepID=A0A4S8IIR3_MUSBA|nr:hypothetical protein C4D60_Mb09t13970 [Musa balbisiana]